MKKFAVVLVLVVCIVAFGGIVANSYAQKSAWEQNREVTTILVAPNDTLYDIAEEYKPSWMDTREYVYEIKVLNGMTTSDIYVGDTIDIYVEGGVQ